tara:strand:- start:438 stop:770 length:333 start_codon:yes stop_codon:yes gene_type:complete
MSITIYHKNLKPFIRNKLTEDEDESYYLNLSNHLIRTGLEEGASIPNQIKVYQEFIHKIQNLKRYKITDGDQDRYALCVLALWKLGVYDPDDETSPIYISPPYKKKLLKK